MPKAPFTILHISDLHISDLPTDARQGFRQEPKTFQHHVGEALKRLTLHLRPSLLAVTGDIVHHAESAPSWQSAKIFLDNLCEPHPHPHPSNAQKKAKKQQPIPRICCPGNHDIPQRDLMQRIRDRYKLYRQYMEQNTDHILHLPQATVLSLAAPKIWNLGLGYIDKKQQQLIIDTFAATSGNPPKLKIILLHQALHRMSWLPPRDYMRGAKTLQNVLRAAQVDLVLTGHNHFIHIEDLGKGTGPMWCQTGTATSNTFAPFRAATNSVVFITQLDIGPAHVEDPVLKQDVHVRGHHLRFDHYHYNPRRDEFCPERSEGWPKSSGANQY